MNRRLCPLKIRVHLCPSVVKFPPHAMSTDSIISKVWGFCTTLRDDGVGYGDYLEQLTYLIFLKMADEYSRPPYNRKVAIPAEFSWPTLKDLKGAELEVHYVTVLCD